MTYSTITHVLDVHDLVDEPGTSRPVHGRLPVPGGLELPLAHVRDLRIDVVLESVVDGILFRGEIGTDLTLSCSRCLEPIQADVVSPVMELYGDPARIDVEEEEVEEGFELADGQIDLDPLLRDVIAAAVPIQPRCREDCQGLCPMCGANRNLVECDCGTDETDPRWSALQRLQLPTDPDDTDNN